MERSTDLEILKHLSMLHWVLQHRFVTLNTDQVSELAHVKKENVGEDMSRLRQAQEQSSLSIAGQLVCE
jgi:hypothetical protein